jgi:hypothetical protein
MHPSDDEAAEHKKEVDADVEIAQMAAKAFDAEKARFGENVVGVMENDERRGTAPTQFQQAKLRARARRGGGLTGAGVKPESSTSRASPATIACFSNSSTAAGLLVGAIPIHYFLRVKSLIRIRRFRV